MANILLVVPFYSGDKGQAERLGKWILALSGGKKINANCLLVGTYDCDPSDLGPLFRQSFNAVGTIQQQAAPELNGAPAWPRACNHQFLHVAELIATNEGFKDYDAFYYFEPDNLPLRADWWDLICAEYNSNGKRFWGVKATNIERGDGKAWEDGFHMIGTGIYPRNAWTTVAKLAEIRKTNPIRPWDVLARDTVNNQCHFTEILGNVHHCRGFREDAGKLTAITREPMSGTYDRREVTLPDGMAVFHGCKDASLRRIMAKRLGIALTDRLSFLHRGDIGDLVYALPAIKALGGGDLKVSLRAHADAMADQRTDAIVPLIQAQDYISHVEQYRGGYVDYDFTLFRELYRINDKEVSTSNLAHIQAEWIGANPDCSNEAWLKPSPTNRKSTGIVVNRTSRYHRDSFPWKSIVDAYKDKILFIGSDQEHYDFCEDFGMVRRQPIADLLEACTLIASSEKFIGNQSCCFAIAEGLKHPRIQETCPERPDCVFESESGSYASDKSPNAWEVAGHEVRPDGAVNLSGIPGKIVNLGTIEIPTKQRDLKALIREKYFESADFAVFIRELSKKRRKKGLECSK